MSPQVVFDVSFDMSMAFAMQLPAVCHWDDLPDLPGLYFVSIAGAIVYVGCTTVSMKQRWRTHKMRAVIDRYGGDIHYQPWSPCMGELRLVEAFFIATMRPRYNQIVRARLRQCG